MSARTRVPRWTPPLLSSLRLVWRPALAYAVFSALGWAALMGTALYYEHAKDAREMLAAAFVGMVGVLLGQLVSILRFRLLPIFVASGISIVFAIWFVSSMSRGSFPQIAIICIFFFFLAFPCGMLSLQHRWELFASFWPSIGWIGAVFTILNREGRVSAWEEEKITAWLPVPLFFLACFLVLWLFYLVSKQALRVELWQSLSGTAARRVDKKAEVTAIPRRNVLPILVVAAALFAITAVLAPYLWRTGRGDREGKTTTTSKPGPDLRVGNGDSLVKTMRQLAGAAKQAALHLWPLLFLVLLYRPVKRGLLTSHLKTPIVPTPPTERIDNLWEYVRIAAEDAGVVPSSSDSVEQLLARIEKRGLPMARTARAAQIYVRTRYGFTVGRGDAIAMRGEAIEAAKELRRDLSTWARVRNLWRPLS